MTLVPEGYKLTFEAQRAACRALAETGSRQAAAEAAGVSLSALGRRFRADPVFRDAMVEAQAAFVRFLEKAAIERATEGIISRVPGPGGVFYDKVIYSDALLIHMLKKSDPEKHGDKQIVHIEDGSTTMGIEQLTPEARQQIKQILLDQMKRATVLESNPQDPVESEDAQSPAEPEADLS